MARLRFTNNAVTTMSGTLAIGGTTLNVASGTGAMFPSLTGADYFFLTLYTKDEYGAEQDYEIVKVTARVADSMTIERDVEGVVGVAGGRAYDGILDTVYVQLRWTAGMADEAYTYADAAAAAVDSALDSHAGNTSNPHSVTASQVGADITTTTTHAATSKTTPVDADEIPLMDSAASFGLKKLTWANAKAVMWAAWGALITAGTAKTTPVDADEIALSDSAASNATKKLSLSNLWTNLLKGKADALYATTGHNHSGVYQPADANLPTWPAAVSATEVGYLDGVTSAIQTQLDARAKKSADADVDMNDYKVANVKTVGFTGYDNGSKSSSFTLNLNNGQRQKVTFTGSGALTITLTSPSEPGTYKINMVNAGLRTITFAHTSGSPVLRKQGGTALSAFTSSGTDLLILDWDGTDYFVSQSLDWKA